MRFLPLLAALLLAAPADAWTFTQGPVCLLTHETADLSLRLTHDPVKPEYSITLTRPEPWPGGPVFALRFDGRRPNVISTDRHALSADGRALTVTDRGFGNVLDGRQFNEVATALIGDAAVAVGLDGAAGPVAAFRVCAPVAGV